MTETSPVSFQLPLDATFDKRVTTVGVCHPHVEAKVIDKQGNVVDRGEVGEVCTRGYVVMKGYWNDDEATKKSIDDEGWMHTGYLILLLCLFVLMQCACYLVILEL